MSFSIKKACPKSDMRHTPESINVEDNLQKHSHASGKEIVEDEKSLIGVMVSTKTGDLMVQAEGKVKSAKGLSRRIHQAENLAVLTCS